MQPVTGEGVPGSGLNPDTGQEAPYRTPFGTPGDIPPKPSSQVTYVPCPGPETREFSSRPCQLFWRNYNNDTHG